MVRQNWILLAVVGSVLIYEASGLNCVVCNSQEANCVDGSKPSQACEAGVISCYLRTNGANIDRGCLPAAQETDCPAEEGSTCIKCTSDDCNNQQLKWPQCHKCATTDATCSDAQSPPGSFCTNYKAANKCYERFSAGKVERGCQSDLPAAANNPCEGNDQCIACEGNNCNSDEGRLFQETTCVQCDTSNDADGKCLDGSAAATKCVEMSGGKCYSRIIANGVLERGCSGKLTSVEVTACTEPTCAICTEDNGCNKGIFPADRLQCHQCKKADSASCSDELTTEVNSKICSIYQADDKCYSRVTAALNFERGCQSDLPANEKSCNGLANCFECDGKNCNSLSEQTLTESTKCQRCTTDDAGCLAGTAPVQSCGQTGDSCFVRINNDGKLERDCLSTLKTDEEKVKCNSDTDKTCISCTAAGCNNQKWLKCHKCKGCKEEQAGEGEHCTNYKESDKCYERFLDGTDVERGCESDLEPATENVCVANQQCKTCSDADGCNKDVSTVFEVTKCVQCKSSEDADGSCLKGTKAEEVCANPDGKCYSRIIDGGILERGCRSALTAQEQTACTGDQCILCGDAGCNKGVFPENRLLCYQCKNTNGNDVSCSNELAGDSKAGVCKIYKADDKCYSRVTATLNFERGCQSDLGENANVCDTLSSCLECDGKNCNSLSEQTLKDSTKCQRCTSDDAGCLAGTAPVQSCGQTGDSCFVRINNDGKLERDCLSTLKTDEEKVKCNSLTDKTCISCTEEGCNNQKWLKCHKCKGDACKDEQAGEGEHCTNYKESDKCYERFLDGTEVERGCESDLEPTTENVCVANQQCKTCSDADGCNKDVSTVFEVTKCVQCKSSEDADGSCLKGTKAEEVCANPDGKCYSRIIAGGILERGCRSALTAQEQTACTGELCNLCGDAGCNKGVFPENRLLCYQCKNTNGNDVSCSNELAGDSKAGVCKIYKADDKCYSRVTATLNFERGCQSDLGENANVCDTLSSCLECDGKNCNSLSEQTLKDSTKCQRCTSDDAGCLAGTAPVQSCGQTGDSCFVRINNDGKLERDCLSTLKTDEEKVKCNSLTDKTCISCTEEGCNNQKWLKCHKCKGDACKDEQAGEGEHCTNYKESDKCYERFLDGTEVERGCESDLEPTTENVCVANQQCKTCSDADGCNKDVSTVFEVTKCVQCKSSEDADGSCLKGTKAEEVCANPDGKCYSRIIAGGILERGCRSALTAQEQTACTGELCNLCGDAGCNKGVFPENRLLCYQCKNTNGNDVSCSNELAGDSKAGVCKIYKADDKCYSRVTATLNFERGCQSDLGENANVCDTLSSCLECDGKNCNSLSEQTLKDSTKCQRCTSDDAGCLAGTAPVQSCGQTGDSCFVRINNDGKLERDCLSTLKTDEEKVKCNSLTDKTCISCTEEGCNNQKWLKCHKCKGDACKDEQAGEGEHCTNYKESDKCYERFLDGTEVERGCESDLEPTTENVCVANQQCKTCSDADGCNKDVSTVFEVTKCVQCKSSEDADGSCLKGTKAEEVCANPDGKCYSRIIAGGILERGCRSALTAQEQTACTGELCNLCGDAGCNKGVFPENRLLCYQCKNTNGNDVSCSNELAGDSKAGVCKIYKADDKCYSRVTATLNFERGCQSDLGENANVCDTLSSCLECDGKNCNSLSEQTLKDSTKCQRCTSDDAGCLAGTAPVQSCGQTGDSCFVRINNDGKLERDCLSTLKTDEEKVKCNSLTDKTCISCTEEGCNNQKWLKCHKCKGDACKDEQAGEGEHCTNYKESDKCYERFLDGTEVERGCESDLEPTTENVCVANQQCKTCSDADGCNKDVSTVFEVTKCVQCKSSEDADGSCLKGTKAEEVCANPDGKCYSRIIAGGILERGCRSALTAQEQTACTGELCNLCGDAGCNKGVFPENRLLCYQCKNTNGNDVSCSNELTGDSKAGVCKIYKADDKCYSRVTATLNFERGCQSDLGDNANVCDALTDCLECDGKNCNSLSEQKLKNRAKCLKCDSEDTSCVDATSEIVSANCDNVEDSCFVRVNNGKLERNCLQTLSEADQAKCKDANDQSCVTCSAQGCNVEKWIKCHQCKESSSSTCNAAQVDGNAQFCPNYKVDNQCYERLESEKVVRGCANDLSEAACTNNLECSTCAESACNKAAANSLKTNQRCLQCSTASDEGGLCLAGTATSQACKKESGGKCFNQVQADGQLKRGCQGELTAAEVTACTGDSCKICDTADCNTGLFPANRLKCYQCKSSADVSCTNELQGADKSLYCKLYVAQDKCYSRDATDKEFERGCQSDLGLNVDACKDLDGKHCKTCDEPDCNAISKIKLNGAGAIALNAVLVVVAAAAAAIAGL